MTPQEHLHVNSSTVHDAVIDLGNSAVRAAAPRFSSSPVLEALLEAGTSHIYADTADCGELAGLLEVTDNEIYREVDGNTVKSAARQQGNRPLPQG